VPNLQFGGQVVSFMTQHLGLPIPSPAIMEKIGTAFRRSVSRFAEDEHIPMVHLEKGDREIELAGYWWELSMRQIETSRTIVFDAPRRARGFFAALVADNLDLGRPDSVELIFTGKHERRGHPRKEPLTFKTKVVTRDTDVTINAFSKHSRVKQYLKHGRALRIETVINSPDDLHCHRRLAHLDELQAKSRDGNARLLDTERVGQGCVLASPAFERVAQSSVTAEGQGAPALRFGDSRVMALLGALCVSLNAVGFTSRSLRAQVSRLFGALHTKPDELRPGPATPERADRTHRGHQHLPAHRRRPTRRDLLHQDPQPAATPAARRKQPTGTSRPTPRATHDRPPCPRLHRRSPTEKRRLKTQDQRQGSEHQGTLAEYEGPGVEAHMAVDERALALALGGRLDLSPHRGSTRAVQGTGATAQAYVVKALPVHMVTRVA
jgi:hypothetical protein